MSKNIKDPVVLTSYFESRVHRAVLDYLLQNELFESAKTLAAEAKLEIFNDIEIFQEVFSILNKFKAVTQLKDRRAEDSEAVKKTVADCIETSLQWCNTYKTKLQSMGSQLEFHLRLMQFIQLIKVDQNMEACLYAKEHFQRYF